MRLVPGKVLILLTIALALVNVHCFAHCIVQACASGAMHCHPEGKPDASHCSHQHDVTTHAGLPCILVETATVVAVQILPGETEASDPSLSPLWNGAASPPLRI